MREGTATPYASTFSPLPVGSATATPAAVVALQRRAPAIMRWHLLRSLVRIVALVVADTSALLLLRALMRGLRDQAWAGSRLATLLEELVPHGTYPSLQLLAGVLLGLAVCGSYGAGDRRRNPGAMFGGAALGFGLLFWHRLWLDLAISTVTGFAFTVISAGLVLVTGRVIMDHFAMRFGSAAKARVLVVGTPNAARETLRSPAFRRSREFELVGYLNSDTTQPPDALGNVDQLIESIEKRKIDTVVVSGTMSDDLFASVVDSAASAGCHVYSIPRFLQGGIIKPAFVWRRGLPLVELTRPSLQGRQLAIKRAIDIVGSGVALAIVAPLLAIIAIAIRLDSRGPVFFGQDRAGLGALGFRMLKFRTMCENADAQKAGLAHLNQTNDARLFKIPNDPRVTRVGAFLRKWSLDELPQLINVFLGQMSLVGPRPFFESDLLTYELHHYRRLGVKPGITGLWQVSGRSSVIDFEEVVRLDRAYIDQWTPWLDIQIMLLTVPAVLKRTGAF